jgi:ribonuclease P protein subunit POP4
MAQPPDVPLAQELLHRAHAPAEADVLYTERVTQRPLFLRPTSPQPSARALRRRAANEKKDKAKKRKNLKPRPLSAAQKRKLGLLELPKEHVKWEIYVPLHQLWLGYMRDILGLTPEKSSYVSPANAGPILVSADMHGALLTISRSRCVSRVGLKGIVVRDSKFVFDIVTEKNQLKSVPKEHTMFKFEISPPIKDGQDGKEQKPLVFEIMGEQFQNRAPERANKKYKMHYRPDI